MSSPALQRTIGLGSAIFILIGFVVGATIFILPGTLAANIGPAVFLSYILAGIPAIFACFVMAQVGGAFPSTGASYIVISKVLNTYWGFIYLCLLLPIAAIIIPLIAYGFAEYLQYFLPQAESTITAVVITVLFMIANCFGINIATKIQSLLVVFFMLALLVFGIAGILHGDIELMKPLLPKGFSPIMLAAVTAYFSYTGVFVITEIAGEVKNPGKTIPRAIFISFSFIIFLYTLVPVALVMVLPWASLVETKIAIVTASEIFLPQWVVNLIAMSALFAAATSINGLFMALSRDCLKAAQVKLFPSYFAKINRRLNIPVRAVIFIGIISLIGIFVGGTITEYAQSAVLGILFTQILTGIAVLKLPRKLPEIYENSLFKLNPNPLRFYSWGLIIFSSAFFLYLVSFTPGFIIWSVIYLSICSIYYKFRRINQ